MRTSIGASWMRRFENRGGTYAHLPALKMPGVLSGKGIDVDAFASGGGWKIHERVHPRRESRFRRTRRGCRATEGPV